MNQTCSLDFAQAINHVTGRIDIEDMIVANERVEDYKSRLLKKHKELKALKEYIERGSKFPEINGERVLHGDLEEAQEDVDFYAKKYIKAVTQRNALWRQDMGEVYTYN